MLRSLAAGIALLTVVGLSGHPAVAGDTKPAETKPAGLPRLSLRAQGFLNTVCMEEMENRHYHETLVIDGLNDDDFRAVVPELIGLLFDSGPIPPPPGWSGRYGDRVCDRTSAVLEYVAGKSFGRLEGSGMGGRRSISARAEEQARMERIAKDATEWWKANRGKTQTERLKELLAQCSKRPDGGRDLDYITIRILASGCHREAAEILLQTLESDADRLERQRPWPPSPSAHIVESLGKLGDKRAVPRLIAVARKTNQSRNGERVWLPKSFATTLNVLTGTKLDAIKKTSRGWVEGGIVRGDPQPPVEKFNYAIKPEAFDAWQKAAEARGKTGADSIPPLMELLKEEDGWVRVAAAEALVKIGPPAVPALLAMLRDKKNSGRGFAAIPLGFIRPVAKETIAALTEVLSDKDPETRYYYVAQALGNIGADAKDAVPALTRILKDGKERRIEPMVAAALGNIGPAAKAAVPALTKMLDDENLYYRKIAAEALQKIETQGR